MKCGKCGTENKEVALFCKECGSKIPKKDKETAYEVVSKKTGDVVLPKKRTCSKCGMENREEALFCKKCGNELPKKEEKLRKIDLPKKGTCGECGTENKEGALFCKKCGNDLSKKGKKMDSEVVMGKTGNVDSLNWFYPAGDL